MPPLRHLPLWQLGEPPLQLLLRVLHRASPVGLAMPQLYAERTTKHGTSAQYL
jgi:hypothetical protein